MDQTIHPGGGQTPSMIDNFRKSTMFLALAAQVLSFPAVVLTRRFGTWGDRYLTGPFCFGFFFPLVFTCFWDPRVPGLGLLPLFWLMQIPLLVIHRIAGVWRRRHGYVCHSQFGGFLWLQSVPWLTKRKQASGMQAILFVLGSMLIGIISPPLAVMLFLSWICDSVMTGLAEEAINARIRTMNDARLEHENLMAIYRERNLGW